MSATTGSGSNVEQANMLAATCVTELCTFLEDQQNSLDLIVGMTNRENLTEIDKRLIVQLLPSNEGDQHSSINNNNGSVTTALRDPTYRADIVPRIIFICSVLSYSDDGAPCSRQTTDGTQESRECQLDGPVGCSMANRRIL
ncbi:hypothetical protein B0O80DRAFT_452628 [Mortierella sp. GBAus27b]|nr:hypothetical protein B0O80DRAFT_452628 [Mortierella sp. GBAus27b]